MTLNHRSTLSHFPKKHKRVLKFLNQPPPAHLNSNRIQLKLDPILIQHSPNHGHSLLLFPLNCRSSGWKIYLFGPNIYRYSRGFVN